MGAWADTSGSCGTGVNYSYVESTHTLTISGTGDMTNFIDNGNDQPWFDYHNDIETVVIENGVTSIGVYAFRSCRSLESIELPTNLTSISTFTFLSCTSLKTITIPDNVTHIGRAAFQASGLTSVSIPAGVESIGDNAFHLCMRLASVCIYAPSLTKYGDHAFFGNGDGRKIYVYSDCVDTYRAHASDFVVKESNIVAMPAFASGECGDKGNNVTWRLEGLGRPYRLVISGTGAMGNYDPSDLPWKSFIADFTTAAVRTA